MGDLSSTELNWYRTAGPVASKDEGRMAEEIERRRTALAKVEPQRVTLQNFAATMSDRHPRTASAILHVLDALREAEGR